MSIEKMLADLNDPSREQFLYVKSVAEEIKPKKVLEIGSAYGICATASLVTTEAKFLSIDPVPNLPQFEMRTNMVGVRDRIERKIGKSIDVLPKLTEKFDLIVVDGDHGYDAVHFDTEFCFNNLVAAGGVILIDDFFHVHNWSGKYGIAKAVSELAKKYGFAFNVNPAAHGIARINK